MARAWWGVFVIGTFLIGAAPVQAQRSYALRTDDRGAWIEGFYPLYEALAQRDLATVRRLTPSGPAINGHGEAGATPLSWLLTGFENTPEELAILAHLLDGGADPNRLDAASDDGVPPRAGVHLYAARHAGAAATQLLLDHGMRFDTPEAKEALLEASASGNLGFLRAVDAAGQFVPADLERLPLLAVAAIQGEYLAVGYLLDQGARPDSVRLDGLTPLHWAVLHGETGIARQLLDAGADPAVRTAYAPNPDYDGKTALELIEVVRLHEGADASDAILLEMEQLLKAAK